MDQDWSRHGCKKDGMASEYHVREDDSWSTVISHSALQLENLPRVANECMSRVATIGDPVSEFEVFKRRFVSHCCLLESTRRRVVSLCCMVTKVTCSTKGSNVAKKIDAWIQKELRDSQYRGCTVAHKENIVYNIYMKPRGNKIDAMPLSGDSESGGCRPGSNLRRIQFQVPGGTQIQKFQEERMEMM